MLVIASNLVLSEADAALPPGTPRILWDNIATFGTVAADSEADGYPISNVTNPATNQEWRAAAAEDVEITVTIGTVDEIDAVGIARHNFGDAEISVEIGYYDGVDWVNLAGPQIPADNEPLLFQFTPQSLSEIVIKLPEGDSAARMAVLYVGPMLTMPRGVDIEDYLVPRFARNTEFAATLSERGDYLGRIVTSQFIGAVEHKYSHLGADFTRDELIPFIRAAQGDDVPFFYAMRADDGVNYDVAYAWFTDDPMPKRSPATGRYGVVFKMGGIAE
jgi:hypothetical protein